MRRRTCLRSVSYTHLDVYKRQLLDIMLPGLDGYELLEYLRPMDTSVIFITAKGTLGDRVKGLNLGADDYIVKPFEVEELIARVESVLRRAGKGGAKLQAFDVIMDTVARSVKQNGLGVALTPREFDLLEQLMRNRGAAPVSYTHLDVYKRQRMSRVKYFPNKACSCMKSSIRRTLTNSWWKTRFACVV